jgi:3-dehydroquinate dehydratase-2
MSSLKILIANGVNMDLLGQREPHLYGTETLADLEIYIRGMLPAVVTMTRSKDVELFFFQSNSEVDYLNEIGSKWSGIVANPGAWTHTSLAIADRFAATGVPFVEVHLSNVFAREDFRKSSFISPHAAGVVTGFGFHSYLCGLTGLLLRLAAAP